MTPLHEERIRNICLKGQGQACCKYLAMTKVGMICGKTVPWIREAILKQEPEMGAKGDNCPGWPDAPSADP